MAAAKVLIRAAPPPVGSSSAPLLPPPAPPRRPPCPPAFDDPAGDPPRRCRACRSPASSLRVDWAQGDRVCTECGVVDEERLPDSRPEWREFSEADDLAKGRAPPARSGLVPVDESLYVGGLQPTTLSRGIYGGGGASRLAGGADGVRRRLAAAARKIDHRMARASRESIEAARLHHLVQSRKQRRRALRREAAEAVRRGGSDARDREEEEEGDGCEDTTDADDPDDDQEHLRPEYERLVLQEEEDVHRRRAALYAEKWSLDRAVRLCGNQHEVSLLSSPSSSPSSSCDRHDSGEEDEQHLDSTLRQASRDLYRAYSMLVGASRALGLPDRVQGEAAALLCRYAARRDGLGVRGVASLAAPPSTTTNSSSAALKRNRSGHAKTRRSPGTSRQEREARAAVAEANRTRQSGALCAAALVYACRRAGHGRPIEEVCASLRPFREEEDAMPHAVKEESCQTGPNERLEVGFIQKKHCARAMNQLREALPDVAAVPHLPPPATVTPSYSPTPSPAGDRSAGTTAAAGAATTAAPVCLESASNLVDRKLRGLSLPPVAQAMVRTLVLSSIADGAAGPAPAAAASAGQLPVLCGAMALFACHSGAVMQRLASQACRGGGGGRQPQSRPAPPPAKAPASRRVSDPLVGATARPPADPRCSLSLLLEDDDDEDNENDGDDATRSLLDGAGGVGGGVGFPAGPLSSEHRAYEMGRVWDAWSSQTPWSRSLADIEQSTGASGSAVLQLYRRHVFPRRRGLLDRVRDAAAAVDRGPPATSGGAGAEGAISGALRRTPLSSVLLPQISLVAPLLSEEART